LRTTAGIVIIVLSLFACKVKQAPSDLYGELRKADNIILMIGDGMGLSQLSAAQYSQKRGLEIFSMPVVGFHKPNSANDLITDSAAGATAFSCGVKTYNGAIGMNNDTLPCNTILSELESRGYATGLIATSTIVHATPAAFIAHRPMRVQYEEIAEDFLKEQVDLFIGGGKRYFDRRDKDERDLIEELDQRNYYVSNYLKKELNLITLSSRQNFAYFTADKHPLTRSAGRAYLPYATQLGASFLKRRSKQGFFLMVEGSQIDWGGHSNDMGLVIDETLDFDEAVAEALRFARRDGNTLVIVTADHECGGMAVLPGEEGEEVQAVFTTNGHTAALVPVFAYGPSAALFSGVYENTEIYHKMREALQLDTITNIER